jgi:hypothetical protein
MGFVHALPRLNSAVNAGQTAWDSAIVWRIATEMTVGSTPEQANWRVRTKVNQCKAP